MINLGKHIRELRKMNRMTLLEVSQKSGVALATLSRIETGRMTGTINSHMAVAKVFDMTLPELYREMDKAITIQKEEEHADVFRHDDKSSSVILTKDIFTKKMLPSLVKLKRGGRTHKEELRRGSEKFLYVLTGKIEAVIGDEKIVLGASATLYFDASRPNFISNVGNSAASCLCVVTPVNL